MCGFEEAKIAYVVARKQQRSKIRDSPKQAGFKVKISGSAGQGICKYTSGKLLDSPFDLSNWMWVESGRDSVLILVTLQVLDQDPKSLHIHALMDRIGVQIFSGNTAILGDDLLFEKCTTEFTLPLSDSDRKS